MQAPDDTSLRSLDGRNEENLDSDESTLKRGGGNDEESREGWSHPIEFMLSCVGYAVGVGNLARFPYIVMQNGGGAYLIPYFFFVVIIGIPLFFLECFMGQFSGRNASTVWAICPLFEGIGYSMICISGVVSVLYNMYIAWSLFYFVESFASPLPWASCGNWWNDANCSDFSDQKNETSSPSVQYWERYILNISDSIDDVAGLHYKMVLALACAWFIVFCCLSKGIRSSGKVAYVTVPLPYLFLTLMIVKGLTLPGSLDGVVYYVKPNFEKLTDYKVWILACVQVFYSLGPAWGGLITMSSYNKFYNRLTVDALVLPLVDCGTSFFGGFAIFTLLGHMAYTVGLPIEKVVTSGPGLAFVVYPAAIALLPASFIFAIVFFLMLLMLGIDSEFGMVETVTTFLFDRWPELRRRRILYTGIICLIFFVLGLPLCTRSGMYYFQILDWYAASITCVAIGFLESFIIAYIYGVNRFSDDIFLMLGFRLNRFFKFIFVAVVPVVMGAMLFVAVYTLTPPTYNGRPYPTWAVTAGWVTAAFSAMPIIVTAVYKLASGRQTDTTLLTHAKSLLKPSTEWQPRDVQLQDEYSLRYPQTGSNQTQLTKLPL